MGWCATRAAPVKCSLHDRKVFGLETTGRS